MSQLALRDCMGKITTHDVQHAPAHTRHTKCDTLGANRWIGIQYGHSDEVFSWNTKCPNTNSRRTVTEL